MINLLGVRKCNPELVHNATSKLSQLIYGQNHPIYQNILYRVTLDRILMPCKLRKVMENLISGSRTMTLGRCQGGDAMLEEINKEAKSWLKMSGIPSNDQWLQVFRNLDDLIIVSIIKTNISYTYKLYQQNLKIYT